MSHSPLVHILEKSHFENEHPREFGPQFYFVNNDVAGVFEEAHGFFMYICFGDNMILEKEMLMF